MSESTSTSCPGRWLERPELQPLNLSGEIRPLIVPTHSCIQQQQALICFAEQALNFSSRDAGFDPYPNRLKLAHFDPTADRDRMQPQFLSGLSYPEIVSITFLHDRDSIT